MNINNCIFTGRIATDLKGEQRKDLYVLKFNLANEIDEKLTSFINMVAFDKLAKNIESYCKKGDKILIRGKYKIQDYEKDGQKKRAHTIYIDLVEFLENKKFEEPEATQEEFPFD